MRNLKEAKASSREMKCVQENSTNRGNYPVKTNHSSSIMIVLINFILLLRSINFCFQITYS